MDIEMFLQENKRLHAHIDSLRIELMHKDPEFQSMFPRGQRLKIDTEALSSNANSAQASAVNEDLLPGEFNDPSKTQRLQSDSLELGPDDGEAENDEDGEGSVNKQAMRGKSLNRSGNPSGSVVTLRREAETETSFVVEKVSIGLQVTPKSDNKENEDLLTGRLE
jgi:hypothetical protein